MDGAGAGDLLLAEPDVGCSRRVCDIHRGSVSVSLSHSMIRYLRIWEMSTDEWCRYAFLPLLVNFEKSAPEIVQEDPEKGPRRTDTALLIPCYKSESLIAATLEAALKIFPAESIFVSYSLGLLYCTN